MLTFPLWTLSTFYHQMEIQLKQVNFSFSQKVMGNIIMCSQFPVIAYWIVEPIWIQPDHSLTHILGYHEIMHSQKIVQLQESLLDKSNN